MDGWMVTFINSKVCFHFTLPQTNYLGINHILIMFFFTSFNIHYNVCTMYILKDIELNDFKHNLTLSLGCKIKY